MKVKGKLHVGIVCAIFVQPSERHRTSKTCHLRRYNSVSAATMTDISESSDWRTLSQPIVAQRGVYPSEYA